ncbi:MAG TPA: hypothetical protein VGB50_04505 [Flavobacterium sp.]|jgi:hypothetical protein
MIAYNEDMTEDMYWDTSNNEEEVQDDDPFKDRDSYQDADMDNVYYLI